LEIGQGSSQELPDPGGLLTEGGYIDPECIPRGWIAARSLYWSDSGSAAKRKGCSVQETGCNISAFPATGPFGVINIRLTSEPGGRSEFGTTKPPVREIHHSLPETRCPS
jgi:hypothetical protein